VLGQVSIDLGGAISITAGLIIVAGGALAALFTLRSNVVQTWKDNYEGEREERQRLEKKQIGWLEDKERLVAEIKDLQAATDLTQLRKESAEFHDELVKALAEIAASASRHHDQQITAISEAQEMRHVENRRMIAGLQQQLQELTEIIRTISGVPYGGTIPRELLPPDALPT
jgi:hypothetical protein